jgi:hypothetical protein
MRTLEERLQAVEDELSIRNLVARYILYMGDAIAGRILKIDAGRVLGSFTGPQPGQGLHFDPHQIALAPDGSIFTAEVLGWRAEKAPTKVARHHDEARLLCVGNPENRPADALPDCFRMGDHVPGVMPTVGERPRPAFADKRQSASVHLYDPTTDAANQ